MGLDLDEWIFGKVARYLKRSRDQAEQSLVQKVDLEHVKPRLTLLARAVSGESIDLFPAEREGGYKGRNFFLPVSFARFPTWEQNLEFYLFRVLYLNTQRELGLNWDRQVDDAGLSLQRALETAPRVLDRLAAGFPAAGVLHEKLHAELAASSGPGMQPGLSWLYGKWMYDDSPEETVWQNFSDKVKKSDKIAPTTLLQARPVEEIRTLTIDKKQQEDYVLLHNFEKVETAEEYNGVWRDFDGKDDLEEHGDALDELNMKFTVRVDDPAHSVYQAEFTENTSVAESASPGDDGFHLKYDEWDFKKRAYKPGFCRVFPKTQAEPDAEYYRKTVAKNASTLLGLRKMLVSVNNKMRRQRKQAQGEEFDIDALTDLFTDIRAGRSPSENIFLSRRKKEKDFSILVLLDISLSSDSYAAGNRVIDVEKEVAILFGEILEELTIDFAVDSFFSKTRNYSTYLTLKGFDEKWNAGKNRIGAVEPQGYTRIGAALRHAGARLDSREAKSKWIILLSDGKPNDYDKYEGKYGIQDVRQALRELSDRDINAYALAIEARARYYLPQMFGQNHYQILTTPPELLRAMIGLYARIRNQ